MSEFMGVDLLDVSFRIRKTIGVDLTQSDWNSLAKDGDVSVGDLYSLLLCRLKCSAELKTDIQLNESVWERTRTALAQVADIPVTEVTLSRRLDELLPDHVRPELWKNLQHILQLGIPSLELSQTAKRTQAIEACAILLGMPMIPTAIIATLLRAQFPNRFWVLPVMAILMSMASSAFFLSRYYTYWERRRRVLPPGIETVKDLCRQIRDLNAFRLIGRSLSHDLDDGQKIWALLKECLVNTLGVDDDEVTMEARFIRDLGAE